MVINKKDKIVVLVGGPSTEAEVSRRTGQAIFKALQEASYNVDLLELNPTTVLQDLKELETKVVFNALHGKYGEDGAIQGLLEIARIPYTGSGIASNALAMNKKIAKDIFKCSNIPTALARNYDSKKMTAEAIFADVKEAFNLPVVVKAATQGSSIGVSIVKDLDELKNAIVDSLQYDHILVVEKFLDGEEFTVAVLDGIALPVIQIKPHSGAYDYTSKYTVGATEYLVPAPIKDDFAQQLMSIAEDTYAAMQCSGVARVDIMTDKNNNPYVLEVNTVPGMTETSLVPKAANARGITFTELCEKILATAGLDKM